MKSWKKSGKRSSFAATLLLTAAVLPAAHAAATQPAAIQPDTAASKCDGTLIGLLRTPHVAGWSAVVAHLTGGGGLTPAQTSRLTAIQADVTRRLPFIGSVALHVPTKNLAKLAALPFIAHLSFDGTVKKCDEFTVASSGAGTAYQQYGLTGTGVTVAVLDSGIQACHPDLQTVNGAKTMDGSYRVLVAPDFTPAGTPGNTSGYCWGDPCGHGSHVAGIIAGNGAASTGSSYFNSYYGIARNANLVSVRVLDQNGASSVSTVISGLQWVVQNKNKYGIRVLNLSLGHPVSESYVNDPLCQAVEAAWKAGIVVVCAAGNTGRLNTGYAAGTDNEGWGTAYGSIQSPANDPYVITVGATKNEDGSRADDRIATYSSRGPSRLDLILKPDLVAPGNRIISLDVDYSTLNTAFAATNLLPYTAYSTSSGSNNQNGAGMSNMYFTLSGTSMAAPVVSGAAALLLQKYPTLTPDTVKARLMAAADKWAFPTVLPAACTADTLNGSIAYSDPVASTGHKVGNVGNGHTLQFNGLVVPTAGNYTIGINYINGDKSARTAYLSVNGGTAYPVSFPGTGSWSPEKLSALTVTWWLPAGCDSITFSNPNGWAPDFDCLTYSGAPADPCTFGAGYLDIPAALSSSVTVPSGAYALSPALSQDGSGNVYISTSIIAANRSVWGTQSLTDLRSVWGTRSVWGSSNNTLTASRSVWGSSVFSDRSVWGSTTSAVDLSSVAIYGE